MSSVENTAEVMTPSGRDTLNKAQTILYFTQNIKSTIQQIKNNSSEKIADEVIDNKTNDLNFTGQYSDIAFADLPESKRITEKDILSCCKGDDELYKNVIQNYNKAVKEGNMNLEISNDKEISFSLSEKGRELIQQNSFMEQFKKDQINYFCNKSQKNTACINLNGNKSDINIFRYVDSFNINSVCDNGGKSQIQEMIIEWEKYGFVRTDTNGNVTSTEKCLDYFRQQDLKGNTATMNVEKVSPSNLNQVAKAVKKTSEASKNVAKAAETTAKATKASATAVKAGTVASSAATAGVSTAVTAVVELSQKGLDFMQKNIDFKSKNITNSK